MQGIFCRNKENVYNITKESLVNRYNAYAIIYYKNFNY